MTIAPRPNRRRFLAAVIATASAAVLVACGSTTTDAAAPDTRVVQHAMGESTVPVAPKRVVVIDSPHLDALVALGITPVGATVSAANDGFPGYLRDQLGGTTSVGSTTSPNVEAIAALRPDLIIGSKVRHEKLYAQLSGIAPTVFSEDSGTNWKEQATVTAAAVNRTDEMAAKLAALDARAVAVGKQVGAPGTTLSIVRFRATAFRLYGPETFSGSVITAMGFTIPQKAWNEHSMVELSPERFDEINGDTVFHTRGAGADPTAATVTTRWGALPAVAAGRAFAVEDETWMVGIGVLGAGRIIDDVQRLVKPVARP
ncbi:Probable siderophore-binding lipoprotein yfiY precursor (plasmid) [Tsukamurella tyrosinosolvens]|uniref:Iron complex transport system substrate-binding protein n=1 Tax=Tsukamurella tyrosinosolvens TaxID=57704 RepID=A0A1H4RXM2_TSUTY|nr:iron-siderophore ABC transporter substrate-binding protein [Tsukamurella tyrosinosolvens]KXO93605.1 iron siderophore-binding protein [Tsukamurella tyrosinosolvens]SEC36660.1 iron complex transport system substrate-binding protein [Tsukamurella tyrosinosolvens]VEH98734.1 Probable siderophore-binding lipoprotein yfiY precursor [Tsukamurella tyrosinosolvens]